MGEMVTTGPGGDELVAIGLGSCIGLTLLDRGECVAGLAHIVLPASNGAAGPRPKFADTAVDALVEAVVELGARRGKLDAVIAGGAKMFAVGGALDVGARNGEAVRAELKRMRIPIRAQATGGTKGRTVRVDVDAGVVTVQEAGGEQVQLLAPRISSVWAATAKVTAAGRVTPAPIDRAWMARGAQA